MTVLDLFRRRPPEVKRSKGWALHFQNLLPASWRLTNYDSFAREGYQQNVIAYSAINRIASAISSMEWQVIVNGKEQQEHPLLDLLNRPNPMQSGPDWWRMKIGYLMLAGNGYEERVVEGGRILELWPLRPDRMTVIPSKTGMPAGYKYRVGPNERQFLADPFTGDSDILHIKLFNPLDDWYGLSPIAAAAYSVDQHNESMTWIQALLQNSARPSGALVIDKEISMSDQDFARLKGEIETNYSGARNTGRPMLLEGGLDWKQIGLSPMDMEILRTKEASARDISLAFGVPPLLLNIPGDNTYANYREARLGFYEDTLFPLIHYILAEFNQWIQPFYPGAVVRPNKDKVEAIADKRTKLWEMADNSDDLTLNESRRLKGFDPLPEPLGSMLMADVRARKTEASPDDPEAALDQEKMKELAYGRHGR